MTRIGIFGLGYVGAVSAAALAERGHEVIGVDTNPTKVQMINSGRSPVIEQDLDDLLWRGRDAGRIRATPSVDEAVAATDVSLICVGTPSNANGSLDMTQIEKVCHEVGLALERTSRWHVVVVRSTMLPGGTEDVVIPALERASGKSLGVDFGVAVNPEFLREGTSLRDFFAPPFTLIGADDERVIATVRDLYSGLEAPCLVVPFREAEMVKYACNAFHAVKITFANEIGAMCKEQGIDSHRVMEILCRDTKLNISSAYLKPGFAFGGSCLPKDLRALIYQAGRLDVEAPMLESVMRSNRLQVENALALIRQTGRKRIGVLGFSFKAGTDDLRESPIVELIERLIGKGYAVRVYDRNVSIGNLQGSNRAYIEKEIPHVASLMADSLDEVIGEAEVIVVGNGDPEFGGVLDEVRPDQEVVDLVRIGDPPAHLRGRYRGITW